MNTRGDLSGPLAEVYPGLFGDRSMRTLTQNEHFRWNQAGKERAIQLGTWPVLKSTKGSGHRGQGNGRHRDK